MKKMAYSEVRMIGRFLTQLSIFDVFFVFFRGSRYSIRAGSTNRLSGGQVRSVIRVINVST
jgi:hypothetical protein